MLRHAAAVPRGHAENRYFGFCVALAVRECVFDTDCVGSCVRAADTERVLDSVPVCERVDERDAVPVRVPDAVAAGDLLAVRECVGVCDGVRDHDGVPAGVGKAVRVGDGDGDSETREGDAVGVMLRVRCCVGNAVRVGLFVDVYGDSERGETS